MFLLIPVQVDVPLARCPWANFLILGTTVVVSLAAMVGAFDLATLESMVLHDWSLSGMIGYMFLHVGILHLAGNMLFLWLFGNAVCAKIGNVPYLLAYLAFGMAAGAGHLLFDGGAAVGASGAVTALVGAYLVLYPINDISCWYLLFIRPGTFSCSSVWMILYWLAWDVLGFAMGSPGVAYAAHLAGFAAGFGALALLVSTGVVRMEANEISIFQVLSGQRRVSGSTLDRLRSRRQFREQPLFARAPIVEAPIVRVPSLTPRAASPAAAEIQVQCACGARLKAPARLLGQRRTCPACRSKLVLAPARA